MLKENEVGSTETKLLDVTNTTQDKQSRSPYLFDMLLTASHRLAKAVTEDRDGCVRLVA